MQTTAMVSATENRWRRGKYIEVAYRYTTGYDKRVASAGPNGLEDVLKEGSEARAARRLSTFARMDETAQKSVALCVSTMLDVTERKPAVW